MIPRIVPPLTDLTVLVTRPAAQCAVLCSEIERQGGVAIAFPTIEIQPVEAQAAENFDLCVFVSVHAVQHGAHLVQKGASTRVACVGKATAAALAAADLPADIVPITGFDSEALLAHPDVAHANLQRVVIIRGDGGRELMQETFVARGAVVETREVYRRLRPAVDAAQLLQIESLWADEGIDVVTVTSVQTLHNLMEMLSERGRELLRATPLLVASRRIGEAAAAASLGGEIMLAEGADDVSMIGALAQWRMRARTR